MFDDILNHTMVAAIEWTGVWTGVIATGLLATRYRVAKPGTFLVRTGPLSMGGIDVFRSGFHYPFHTITHVPIQPRNFKDELKCLSAQYLPFRLPVNFTLSPFLPTDAAQQEQTDDGKTREISGLDLFKRYVEKLEPLQPLAFHETVIAAIHGEARILTATMSIDDMNDNRAKFHTDVVKQIQERVLFSYGLKIDAANIAEIHEEKRPDGHMGYLAARERKKLEEAVQQSNIDVSKAQMDGDIGKKQRETETRQTLARLEAQTMEVELKAKQQIATSLADLAVVEAESRKRKEISNVEANAATAQKKEELQTNIEISKATQAIEAQRAEHLTKTKVENEQVLLRAKTRKEEAEFDANATEIKAKAQCFAAQQAATGALADLNAKAAGELAMLQARAEGTKALAESCDKNILVEILQIQHGIPQKQAEEMAKALKDMCPTVYSITGDNPTTAIARLLGGLGPVYDIWQKAATTTTTK